MAGLSSSTRGVFGGGLLGADRQNRIDYITIASTGNGTDFGDLQESKRGVSGASSPTRGLFLAVILMVTLPATT
jgi:hypothetical protein